MRTAEAKRQRAEDKELWAMKAAAERQYDAAHREERRQAAQQRRDSDPGFAISSVFASQVQRGSNFFF